MSRPRPPHQAPPRTTEKISASLALVEDLDSPFFSTPHFDGHPSVLIRAHRLRDLSYAELAEIVQDAWLARASDRRGRQWLDSRGLA
jgi:hypothetical protein